jgi:hypothetical protein
LYSTEQRSGNTAFLLGDLFADEEKTLVLELHIPAMNELGQIEVAKMTFDPRTPTAPTCPRTLRNCRSR